MSKPTVSLVIIDTSTYRLASQAVQHSVQNFPFDEILIFSDVTSEWEGRDVHIIPRIQNLTAYSEFVIFKLPSFIKTDFFLIIQWDGFVIRGDEFSPHFYHYDYIGALWPWYTEFRVGNGGFSWGAGTLVLPKKRIARECRRAAPAHSEAQDSQDHQHRAPRLGDDGRLHIIE